MKHQLMTFARDVDAFCGKLNEGLTAVAVLLGLVVITMSVIRVQEIAPDLSTMPAGFQMTLGQ